VIGAPASVDEAGSSTVAGVIYASPSSGAAARKDDGRSTGELRTIDALRWSGEFPRSTCAKPPSETAASATDERY